MLEPAISNKKTVEALFCKMSYSDKLFEFQKKPGIFIPSWEEKEGSFQYVSIKHREPSEGDGLTSVLNDYYTYSAKSYCAGFFKYEIENATRSVRNISMISFDKIYPAFIKDVYNKVLELMNDYDRIEFEIVGGNPSEKQLDRFVSKFGGSKNILHNRVIDNHGKIRDWIIYEIITKHNH